MQVLRVSVLTGRFGAHHAEGDTMSATPGLGGALARAETDVNAAVAATNLVLRELKKARQPAAVGQVRAPLKGVDQRVGAGRTDPGYLPETVFAEVHSNDSAQPDLEREIGA
jgi:hypothetical protein